MKKVIRKTTITIEEVICDSTPEVPKQVSFFEWFKEGDRRARQRRKAERKRRNQKRGA